MRSGKRGRAGVVIGDRERNGLFPGPAPRGNWVTPLQPCTERGSVWVGGESLPRCVPGESRQSATRSQDAAASKRRLPPSSPLLFLCASGRGPFEPTRAADTAPCPPRLSRINKSLIKDECGLAQTGGSFAKDNSVVAASVCLKSLVSVKKPQSSLG